MVEGTGAYLVTFLTVDGEKYTFDGKTPLRIVSGTGMPEARITNSAKPLQNFSYVEYRTFAPRKLACVVQIAGGNNRNVWAARQRLIRVLNPLRGTFTFIYSYPNKNEVYYAYDVLLTEPMDCPLDTRADARYAEFPLALTAFDPFWYGATNTEMYMVDDSETLVVSAGTAHAKPVITFTGPLTDPILTNTIWSGIAPFKIHVLGAIAGGDSVVVDARHLTVTRTSGTGAALSSDSTLLSFGLIPAALGALGNNHIDITATGAYVGSQITMTWQDTYYAL
jgi:hypothetical protein